MMNQKRAAEIRETLLLSIQTRLEDGNWPVLKPSEAGQLLQYALDCDDPARRDELLTLFSRLNGLDMVLAALSDFD